MASKNLRVLLLFLVIMQAHNFGSTMPSLPQKDVLVTSEVTAAKLRPRAYPKTPEQVDYLMYLLQFSGTDIPKLFQIYKNETLGYSLEGKLEAAMSVFRKIDYDTMDDDRLQELVKINTLLKGTYCKNTTTVSSQPLQNPEQTNSLR